MDTDTPRGHILTVTKADDYDPDHPSFNYSIECLNRSKCDGWQECGEDHGLGDVSAACGPYDCDCGGEDGPSCLGDEPDEGDRPAPPWRDQEEFEFHGVLHTWRDWYWTVPYPGCVVAPHDDDWYDDARDIAVTHGCGRHLVDDNWGDEICTLAHIRVLDQQAVPTV